MGNLIIKGKGGAGNKLIIQDQAGAAVLTTADSGATIANATITAPTIANMANCTFPTGHILGVQNAVMQGTQAISTSLIDVTDGTTALSVTSTNTTATKFYIVAMVYCGTDNDVGTHFELWSKIDGAS